MNEEAERRLARNEVLFRDTNEAIERGQWTQDLEKPMRFRCECSRLDCGEAVEITLREYEEVRRFPRRFVLALGHNTPEIETIVGRGPEHLVVEKQDTAGAIAAAADPRQ
jgi:hypothetical protein